LAAFSVISYKRGFKKVFATAIVLFKNIFFLSTLAQKTAFFVDNFGTLFKNFMLLLLDGREKSGKESAKERHGLEGKADGGRKVVIKRLLFKIYFLAKCF
jgi:hypothetical protein